MSATGSGAMTTGAGSGSGAGGGGLGDILGQVLGGAAGGSGAGGGTQPQDSGSGLPEQPTGPLIPTDGMQMPVVPRDAHWPAGSWPAGS